MNQAETYKAGDVVRLKSGGPLMTVEAVRLRNGETFVDCVWSTEAGPHEHTFSDALLEAQVRGGVPITLVTLPDGSVLETTPLRASCRRAVTD